MALYFKDTEITNIDNLVPQSGLDITDMWFGTTNVYTVWAVYDGILPATLNANGDNMRQYQVYGATGGVGDKTVNYHDGTLYNSVWRDANFNIDTISPSIFRSTKTFLTAGTYTICFGKPIYLVRQLVNGEYKIPNVTVQNRTFTLETDGYVGFSFRNTTNTSWNSNPTTAMFTEGTSPPENYVPYGYEVDISTSDGTNATVTPIYIGDDPLGKDEYIDYQDQKVFRRTVNMFDKHNFVNSVAKLRNCNIFETQTGFKIVATGNDPYVNEVVGDGSGGSYLQNAAIPVKNATTYIISASDFPKCYVSFVNASFRGVSAFLRINANPFTFTTPQNCVYVILRAGKEDLAAGDEFEFQDIMLTEGTTPPENYVPYLTPTDPPIPLPALPTCKGTTIVDYAGESQATPEKVLLKYRKKNF